MFHAVFQSDLLKQFLFPVFTVYFLICVSFCFYSKQKLIYQYLPNQTATVHLHRDSALGLKVTLKILYLLLINLLSIWMVCAPETFECIQAYLQAATGEWVYRSSKVKVSVGACSATQLYTASP